MACLCGCSGETARRAKRAPGHARAFPAHRRKPADWCRSGALQAEFLAIRLLVQLGHELLEIGEQRASQADRFGAKRLALLCRRFACVQALTKHVVDDLLEARPPGFAQTLKPLGVVVVEGKGRSHALIIT